MQDAAEDIANSGFTTVILGQFHVHSDGTIYYNDSPLDTVGWALTTIPKLLKSGGSVQRVLLTFGPFGSDFANIGANLASFQSTMAGVLSAGGLDGLDWDVEQDLTSFTELLVNLTVWANGLGYIVTAAPYNEQSFWTNLLQKTTAAGGSYAWWNLQLYGGAVYSEWASVLPPAFLYAGFANTQGATPSSIQADLQALVATYPTLTGGFLWRYESIAGSGYTTQQYAQGILDGLAATAAKRRVG